MTCALYNETNMRLSKKSYFVLAAIALVIIALNALFTVIDPNRIVEYIGVRNAYAIVFIVGAIGGLSSFTGGAYFTTLATFGAGVSSPLLLGLVGGLGIFISDTIFFYLAHYGRKSIPEKWSRTIETWSKKARTSPMWLVLLSVYIYIGFTPLPNDLLMLLLVVAGFTYRQLWPVFLLGSVTIATIVAHFGNIFGF